ncbi:MAG: xanthine dehydrogenase family protein [Spirochaetes bacterium]|nr:xanthine dehydrogenase family protein [Spirochaetota bacterium]
MLYARTLRSTVPRARIVSIDIPAMPEGYFVVDARDVPGKNGVHMLTDEQPFFAEERVNYVGEPILLVTGPERGKIDQILRGIRVEYEEIPPVFGEEDSKNPRIPPLFGERNLFCEYEIRRGEVEEAFFDADFVFEGCYHTGAQEHVYLEPQGTAGVFDGERVTVYGSMQCPYYVKTALVGGLGWKEDRIRVVQATTGGAFGGKEEYPSIIAGHVAFAAIKTGRPVLLVFDRAEDVVCTTKRHPSLIRMRTAVDDRGAIRGMEIDIALDGGAYVGLSPVVLQRAMFAATGVYRIPCIRVKGRVFATNSVPTGAFRGFGAPQAFFAVEMHMHSLAEKLRKDPLEFKRSYLLSMGDPTVTDGRMKQEVPLPRMIDRLCKLSGYEKKHRAYKKEKTRRGIGVSLFFHGCAFTGSGEKDKIKAKVLLKKEDDESVSILVSNVEMGQGAQTTLKKIVAETLGCGLERVRYDNPDTDRVPDSGPTVASRTVMIVGGLLAKAAGRLKRRMDEKGEVKIEERYVQPPHIEWDQDTFTGDAYPVYSWGANAVEVEVDPVTFEVRVIGVWGIYDVGTPIDERIVGGQIEGGISQGLGYATIELLQKENGRLRQKNLTDYIIPSSMDFPDPVYELFSSSYEHGPFGAKCAGELPFVGVAPAVAAAVQNAIGRPVRRLPVSPEYLFEAEHDED